MKLKTTASLMIALVLGVVTAYVGVDVVNKAKKGAQAATRIVVAARDMEPGYVIDNADLKLEDVPATLVPAKSFKDPKLVAGRTVLASVVRGYPLIENQLAAPGSGAGMQAMVPKGMRAVAVEVSESSAVAGLITPGCFVDVIATFNNGDQQVATTVVQNVKVQFVQRARAPRSSGSSSSSSSGSSAGAAASAGTPELGAVKTVTLIVTPKQANAIELANNQGRPRLVLRGGADDNEINDSAMVKQNELLGIPDPPPPATQPAPPPPTAVVAAPPPALPVVEKVTDAFSDPPPVPTPASTRRPVQILRAGAESTIYFDEDGDRSLDEEPGGGAALASNRRQPSKQPPAAPTTRPLSRRGQPHQQQQGEPKKAQNHQEQQQQRDVEASGEPRTASGQSPGEPAPRNDVVQRELRKGN